MPLSTSTGRPEDASPRRPLRSTHPVTCPVSGSMRVMEVSEPRVGEHLALHVLQFVEVSDEDVAVAHFDATDLVERVVIEEAEVAVPSLTMSSPPSSVSPHPSVG